MKYRAELLASLTVAALLCLLCRHQSFAERHECEVLKLEVVDNDKQEVSTEHTILSIIRSKSISLSTHSLEFV